MSDQAAISTRAKVYEWIGKWVLVKYMTGPSLNADQLDEVVTGTPQARAGLFLLQEAGNLGIVLLRTKDHPGAFIPWSAVLVIVGPPDEADFDEADFDEDDHSSASYGSSTM